MDRSIVYAGAGAQDTDLLFAQRGAMVAIGLVTELVLGNTRDRGPVVTGLAVQPGSGLQVSVGRGALFGWDVVDATAYGSLGADAAHGIVHCAVNPDPVALPDLVVPTGAGQQTCYLVEAQASVSDAAPMSLPFWNAADPSQPYLGPNNSGGTVPTQRLRRVRVQARAGQTRDAGFAAPPSPDGGWVPLAVVTLQAGQFQIGDGDVAVHPQAPTLPFALPLLTPGFSRREVLTVDSPGGWVVPNGVRTVKATVVAGGGGGSSGTPQQGGAGGGAGGMGVSVIRTLIPGSTVPYLVGAGGAGGDVGGEAGAAGEPTTFGSYVSAYGGQPGQWAATYSPGGAGGAAGGGEAYVGGWGGDAMLNGNAVGGCGAPGPFGGGRAASGSKGLSGTAAGAGGGGSYGSTPGAGGDGCAGVIILEY